MRRSGLFWGIILVLVGVIFLLDNLGVFSSLSINIWGIVLPSFMLLAGAWLVYGAITGQKRFAKSSFSIPSGNYEEATIDIEFHAGELIVSAASDPEVLLEGDFEGGVKTDQKLIASGIHASLETPGDQERTAFTGYPRLTWDIRLNPHTPLQLDITTGAVEADIDLRKLQIRDFDFETGASKLQIYFPEIAGHVHAKIKGGATDLNIHIPQTVPARIITDSGLSTFHIDEGRFLKTGNIYASVDFEAADDSLELILELGLSTVDIS